MTSTGTPADWRTIVASALDWEQAHANLDSAIANLPAELRGRRADGLPHSVWELVEHIRLAQHDLLDFCVNDRYEAPAWPDDYWPSSPEPESESAWAAAIDQIHRDTATFAALTTDTSRDLTAKIPQGTGQTYLRTILLAMDHTSHHVGQIIDVRRLLGSWPA